MKGSSSAGTDATSPSHSLVKKNRLHSMPITNQSSQSDVTWRYEASSSFDSPQRKVGGKSKQKSANQLLQTPVRIVKRHVSSPNLNSTRSQTTLSRFERLDEIPEVNITGLIKAKYNSFDLSSEEFKFDLDDEQILDAAKHIDDSEKKNQSEGISNKPANDVHAIDVSRAKLKETKFDDSFDDAMLNSIPLDEIIKRCSSNSSLDPNVDIVFDHNQGLSQVLIKSPKPLGKTAKLFERHTSFPSMMRKEPDQGIRNIPSNRIHCQELRND